MGRDERRHCHDGQIALRQEHGAGFVLVRKDGVPAIPARYENNLIGTTDPDGHLMVPSVPGYYAAKYEIDP